MDVSTTDLFILGVLIVLALGIMLGFSGQAKRSHGRDEKYGRDYDHAYDHHFDPSYKYHDDSVEGK